MFCAFLGKSNLDHKNYEKSAHYYCLASKQSPKNYDYAYSCITSLKQLPMTYKVQKQVYEIYSQNKGGAIHVIANNILDTFKDKISKNYEPNYIENVFSYGKIIRWDKTSFPLKVYWKNPSEETVPQYFQQAIQTAFNSWQIVSKKQISFENIDNIEDANIVIDFNVDSSNLMQECMLDSCVISLATTEPVFNYDILKKMTIIFNTKGFQDEYLSANQVYRVALHEIGHALGLLGHSDNPEDLMYMSDKDVYMGAHNISLSDLNTLKLLYQIVPDVSDVKINKDKIKDGIYSPIILGNQKQLNIKAYEKAVEYIKQAPDNINGWINLAGIYFDAQEYDQSLLAVKQAIKHVRSNNDLYLCYYNFAIIYNETGELNNALMYAKKSFQLDSTPASSILLAKIYYNANKFTTVQTILEPVVKQYSDNVEAIDVLTSAYIRTGHLFKAAKVFKKCKIQHKEIDLDTTFPNKKFIIFLSQFV